MRSLSPALLSLAILVAVASVSAQPLGAQTREKGPWWPHPLWGSEDQAGASNWITPEKILQSLELVKRGQVFELGHVYSPQMPLVPPRTYSMSIVGWPTWGPYPAGLVGFDEIITTQLGQVGTQFDGLGHPAMRTSMADGTSRIVFYNGFTEEEVRSSFGGLRKLGVEHVKPIITRGILVDVARYKGLDVLPAGSRVTVADVIGALTAQGMSAAMIRPGDALLVRYGWAANWNTPERFLKGSPEVEKEVAAWLAERQVSVFGEDGVGSNVHFELITQHGIFMLEAMDLNGLAAEQVYEFLFLFTPIRLQGATGSPGRPLAIR